MTRRFVLRAEAERDIADIIDWYEGRRKGLGKEFLFAVEGGLERIEGTPERYRLFYKHARRVNLARFPYALYYIVRSDVVEVFACIHHRRHPRHLHRRVRDS